MKIHLLLLVIVLSLLLFACSNVQVGFGVSIVVNLISKTDEYIEFQVIDQDGTPISNITLQVQIDDTVMYVKTDENGYVRIYGDFKHKTSQLLIVKYAIFEFTIEIELN